jgi:hypothetical protein
MTSLVALSVSIGVLGGVATWLAVGLMPEQLQIWAMFIAWATFFATGGTTEAAKNTVVCGIFGVILAWIAGLVIAGIPVALPMALWPAIVVAVTVFLLVAGAHVEWLSTIPASVYGYASCAAYMLLGNALNTDALLSPSFANPLILISVSIAVGTAFGWASGKLGAALTASE